MNKCNVMDGRWVVLVGHFKTKSKKSYRLYWKKNDKFFLVIRLFRTHMHVYRDWIGCINISVFNYEGIFLHVQFTFLYINKA